MSNRSESRNWLGVANRAINRRDKHTALLYSIAYGIQSLLEDEDENEIPVRTGVKERAYGQ